MGQFLTTGRFFSESIANNGTRGAIWVLMHVKTRGKTSSLAAEMGC